MRRPLLARSLSVLRDSIRPIIALAALLLAAVIAYQNSLAAPLVFDDAYSVELNPYIRGLWPLWHALVPAPARPLVNLTFMANYALGGLDVRGYHLVNIIIHWLAAATLYGLVRRTLHTATLRERFASSAHGLALAVALLWLVHPLQTQSVTYIAQRAESLMGLWYLLMLYAVARSSGSPREQRWWTLAIGACALGMMTKPIMVTAPLVVWLYDRVFLAGSWRGALRARGGLHLGLAWTWAVPLIIMTGSSLWRASVGFSLRGLSPWWYAATQAQVILHYLRLVVWPDQLCLDYAWPVARRIATVAGPMSAMAGLFAALAWAWRRAQAAAFCGASALVILAPTSSLLPLADLAMEHRMYLPLASILALLVVGGWSLLQRWPLPEPKRRALAVAMVSVLATAACWRTIQRNADYRSGIAIWSQTAALRPLNLRAHNNLGWMLSEAGRFDEAIAEYQRAIALKANYAAAYNNLGLTYAKQDRLDEAIGAYHAVLAFSPSFVMVHNNLGDALARQGRLDEAIAQYREAIELLPDYVEAHYNLGRVYRRQGHLDQAMAELSKALQLDPDHRAAREERLAIEGERVQPTSAR